MKNKKWWKIKTGYNFFLLFSIHKKNFFLKNSFYKFVQNLKISIIYKKYEKFLALTRFPFLFAYEFNYKLIHSTQYLQSGTTIFLKNYEIFFDYLFHENILNNQKFIVSIFFRKKKKISKIMLNVKKYFFFGGKLINNCLRKKYLECFNFMFYLNKYKKKFIFTKFSLNLCKNINNVSDYSFLLNKKNFSLLQKSNLFMLKHISIRKTIFFYKNIAIIFFWLKKKWNQKRMFGFFIFRRFIFKIFQNRMSNGKKKKILIKIFRKKKKNENSNFLKIRNAIKSPSSKRIEKILVIKLSELLRDFYPVIRRNSFVLINQIFSKGCCFKKTLLFFSKKILESIKNEIFSDKQFLFKPLCIKFLPNQIRIYENIDYLNFNFVYFLNKKKNKKKLFNKNIFCKKKKNLIFQKNFIKMQAKTFFLKKSYENEILKSFFTSFKNLEFFFPLNLQKKNFFKINKLWKIHYLDFFVELLKKKKLKKKKNDFSFCNKICFNLYIMLIFRKIFCNNKWQSFFLNIISKEIRTLKNFFLYFAPRFFKLFKNREKFFKLTDELKNGIFYLKKKCFLISSSFLIFLYPNILSFFLEITSTIFFSKPSVYLLESFFIFKSYFLRLDQDRINRKKKKIHQNHFMFLTIARMIINVPQKNEKIWHSCWENFIFFIYNFCLNPFKLIKRIIRELEKKIRYNFFKQNNQQNKKFEIKIILLVSELLTNSGRFFFYKKIQYLNQIPKSNKNKISNSKKNFKLTYKKHFEKKKVTKIKKYMKLISKIILKQSRRILKMSLTSLMKFFCFFNCNRDNLIFYTFFLCYYFSYTEIHSIILVFFSEIIQSTTISLQKQFQKIGNIFHYKNFFTFKKLFCFFLQFFHKIIFKPNLEYFGNIFSFEIKKIALFKIRNIFIIDLLVHEKICGVQNNLNFILTLINTENLKESEFKLFFELFLKLNKNLFPKENFIQKNSGYVKFFNQFQKFKKITFCMLHFIRSEKDLKKFIDCFMRFQNILKNVNFWDEFFNNLFNIGNQPILKYSLFPFLEKLIYLKNFPRF